MHPSDVRAILVYMFFAAIVVVMAILLSSPAEPYSSASVFDSYPPRDKFPRVYRTVRFKDTVCAKCHPKGIRPYEP